MALLDDVKTILDITADNASEDEKLNLIIENGKQHLRYYNPLLSDTDFEEATKARALLYAYCRYAYSNAAEMFDINWHNEILALRRQYEVSAYENQDAD